MPGFQHSKWGMGFPLSPKLQKTLHFEHDETHDLPPGPFMTTTSYAGQHFMKSHHAPKTQIQASSTNNMFHSMRKSDNSFTGEPRRRPDGPLEISSKGLGNQGRSNTIMK